MSSMSYSISLIVLLRIFSNGLNEYIESKLSMVLYDVFYIIDSFLKIICLLASLSILKNSDISDFSESLIYLLPK